MPIPTNRTTANTAAEHLSDHNLMHAQYNAWEGRVPANFALVSHTHAASEIVGGVLAPQRLGSGTPSALTWLRGDGWQPLPAQVPGITDYRFWVAGPLQQGIGATRQPVYGNQTIKRVTINTPLGAGPSGAAIIVDINLWLSPFTSGTTIWATQSRRVTIAPGVTIGTQTIFDTTAIPDGAFLTADIDQVGSPTTPGSNLLITVSCEAA